MFSNGSNYNGLNENNQQIKIGKLYTKKISYKISLAPDLFETTKFKKNVKTQLVATQKFEVILHIIHGKTKNISLFTLEAQQVEIFVISVPAEKLKQVIKNNCVSFLYQHLSQLVINTIIQVEFLPIMLQPIIKEKIEEQSFNQKNKTTRSVKYMQN